MKLLRLVCLFFVGTVRLYGQSDQSNGNWLTAADGVKIYYEVAGSGKPVILIHGFIVNSNSWKRTSLYSDLIANGYQVITLDLRGNGKSDKPHDEKFYVDDAEAKDVMRLADELKLKDYAVVGYSRGAIIASRVLILDKRATSAVIGGMGLDFTNPQWPRRIMFYEALSGKRDVPELEGLIRYINESGLDREALALMQFGQPSTTEEEFKKGNKPVLVICGSEDQDNGSAKSLADIIPGARYTVVPGNHNNAAQTPMFSNEVLEFLASTGK
jgi:pimeloyl-ACP methyl ester carboxylesterase